MARASAWVLGSALAYQGLDLDAQAEILALFQAARMEEAREAKETLQMAVAEPLQEWVKSRKAGAPGAPPSVPTAGAKSLPAPTVGAKSRGSTDVGVPDAALPAIMRPRLNQELLVSGS